MINTTKFYTPAQPEQEPDDSLFLCASDLEHSAIYDSRAEMQSCVRAVASRIKALAATQPAQEPVAWIDERPVPVYTAPQPQPAKPLNTNIHSPFNACMYRDYCKSLETPPTAQPAKPLVAEQAAGIKWPKARDVGRLGDMSTEAHLRVGMDRDNDVYVSVWDENGGASIEFCNGGGGGSSMQTRLALVALMCAIEDDNAARPDKDWWARRMGKTTRDVKEQS